jgi:hypothetical protein
LDLAPKFAPGETVLRVLDPDFLFGDFGRCDICGDPADIVLRRDATINGHQRFCASCLRDQDHSHEAFGKRNKRKVRTCPLCGGKWDQSESADGVCTTRNKRDIAYCLKYRFLRRELDADDLARPYVTTGPYCPWPQVEPDLAIRQDSRPETEQERAEIDRLAATVTDPYESARTLARETQRQHRDLSDYLREHYPDLLDEHDDCRITAAESIISTCKRLDIAPRLGDDGCLVVGCEESAVPPSRVMAVEAHVDEIGQLLLKEPAPAHAVRG